MPLALVVMFLKAIADGICTARQKAREEQSEPLCVDCSHAHVQYAAKAKRAISCTYGGDLRPMELDVMYCTDYRSRDAPAPVRVVGFVREIAPAE